MRNSHNVQTIELAPGNDLPECPHCKHDMEDAVVQFRTIVEHWPFRRRGKRDGDGYRMHNSNLPSVACPACERESVIVICGGLIELLGMRTEKDMRYMEPHDA